MVDADDILIEALLDDVLDPSILRDAVDVALGELQADDGPRDRIERIEADIDTIEQERARLVTAIATGGNLGGLLEALRARETRRASLEPERAALVTQTPLRASDAARVREELMVLAKSWRQVLVMGAIHARPIVTSLLIARVSITPMKTPHRWVLRGEGTLRGLFSKVVGLPLGMASPTRLTVIGGRLRRAA
jgi:hypothetical protein